MIGVLTRLEHTCTHRHTDRHTHAHTQTHVHTQTDTHRQTHRHTLVDGRVCHVCAVASHNALMIGVLTRLEHTCVSNFNLYV